MNDFKTIMTKHNTDKIRHYCDAYHECTNDIRNDVKLLFEIGVFNGASVNGWREYFPNAVIVGVDINPNCKKYETDTIKIEIGNASNRFFINSLIKKYGNPDIVIDDGSHISTDIIASLNLLFNFTKMCYVIEDLDTQFGAFGPGFTPRGTSAMPRIYKEIDKLMKSNNEIQSIKIYFPIVFLIKTIKQKQ